MFSQQSGIEKRATQSSAKHSQQKPLTAPIAAWMLTPEKPVRSEEQEQPYDAAKDSLYRWYLRATIIGAFVALGGLFILWLQSRHLQSQIRLQQRAQRQWVNTSGWNVTATGLQTSDRRPIVEISFALSNETQAPITLIAITFNSLDHPAHIGAEGFAEHSMLLPNNPFRPTLRVPLSKEEDFDYLRDGALFRISGMILYADALEDTWRQNFEIFLTATRTSLQTSKYVHTLRKVRATPITLPRPAWRKAIDWYVAKIEAMKNGDSEP